MVRFGPNAADLEGVSKKDSTTEASLEARQRDALLDVLIERRSYRRGTSVAARGVRHRPLFVQVEFQVQR